IAGPAEIEPLGIRVSGVVERVWVWVRTVCDDGAFTFGNCAGECIPLFVVDLLAFDLEPGVEVGQPEVRQVVDGPVPRGDLEALRFVLPADAGGVEKDGPAGFESAAESVPAVVGLDRLDSRGHYCASLRPGTMRAD